MSEQDNAPASWSAWWRWTEADGWTHHVREERPAPPPTRRLRGNQDYKTLHLGRGTKWAK